MPDNPLAQALGLAIGVFEHQAARSNAVDVRLGRLLLAWVFVGGNPPQFQVTFATIPTLRCARGAIEGGVIEAYGSLSRAERELLRRYSLLEPR